MDPPTLMNESSFQSANGSPYNFSEIWPFPINAGGESSRRTSFVADLSHLATDDVSGGAMKRRDATEEASSANAMNGNDSKRLKISGSGDENENCKGDGEGNSGKGVSLPPKDYIHVRARRGQATDSHSLAERARREKISERMKILQDLVPGCNKVIGKALVLDEIINYIQSLQRQVEFLSMKLEAVNSRMNIGMEGYPSKDFIQPAGFDPSAAYGSQPPREYVRGSSPEWLHMQVGSGFERQT